MRQPRNTEQQQQPQQAALALWLMLLGSPVLWLIGLQISYTMVPYACSWGSRLPLVLTALLTLLLVLANALWAWRRLHVLRHLPQDDLKVKRAHFMARTGAWLSLLFALLIALQGTGVFFIDPCRL